MPNVTDSLRDSAARHEVYMLRYSRSTYRRHLNLIDEAIADITHKLTVRPPASGSVSEARLNAVLAGITETSKELYKGLSAGVSGDLRKLADYEAEIQIEMLNDAFPIQISWTAVTGAQIHSAAMSQPFRGKVLAEWWRDQEYGVRKAYQSAVRLGFVEGESISQIVSRVRDVGDMNRQQAEAVIRTAVNHTAQRARSKITEANQDIFKGEVWVSTLDGRTSDICMANDGKTFEIGKGQYPPAHFNCRSQRIGQTKSWKELGFDGLDENDPLSDRPFVADKRRVKDIPKNQRDAIIGRTDKKTYNDWLKTQPKSFVEDVLGKKKAKLYLDGNVSLDRFVDRKGSTYTLEELAKRERSAFTKAGVSLD